MERHVSILALLCLLYFNGLTKITTAQTTTTIGPTTCTEAGKFEINDGTCKRYYMCVYDGEKLNAVTLTCAASAIFEPTNSTCVPADEYTCQQTTTSPPSTQAPCVRYGRFPMNDVNCKGYYLCYSDGIGFSRMDNLRCPNTLLFNPTSGKCVLPQNYVCPTAVTGQG